MHTFKFQMLLATNTVSLLYNLNEEVTSYIHLIAWYILSRDL